MKNQFIGIMFHAGQTIFGLRCNLEPDTALSLNNKWETVSIAFNEATKKWIVNGVLPSKDYRAFKQELDIAMLEYKQVTDNMRLELMRMDNICYTTTELKNMSSKFIRMVYAEPRTIPDYMLNIVDCCD